MKNRLLLKTFFLPVLFSTSAVMFAQESTSEVHVRITKEGKTIKDTTYIAKDSESADMALKMLDMTLGEKHMKKPGKMYVFTDEHGDSMKCISGDDTAHHKSVFEYTYTIDEDDDSMTILVSEGDKQTIQKKIIVKPGENEKDVREVEKIIIVKKDGEERDVPEVEWLEEGGRKILIIDDGGKEKTIKVFKGEGEPESKTFITEDGKMIIIKESNEENSGKKIEVIVDDKNVPAPGKKTDKKQKK